MAKVSNIIPGGSGGNVLEIIGGMCDGRTVSGVDRDYTLPNVTAYTSATTSHVELNGSALSYKPPADTKTVIYRLWFNTQGRTDYNMLFHVQGQLGDGAGSESFTTYSFARYSIFDYDYSSYNRAERFNTFTMPIRITGTDDIANSGTVASWDDFRTIRCTIREYSSSYDLIYNYETYWDGTGTNNANGGTNLRRPHMEIVALST